MRTPVACMAVVVAFSAVAAGVAAQQLPNVVTRADSQVLLDMPQLENGRETYQYFGWNKGFTQETSYAAVSAASGGFPRAQIYLRQLGKGRLWTGSRLDEAWIRNLGAFFKERQIAFQDGPKTGTSYVTTIRFTVDSSPCLGFMLRPVSHDRQGSATGNGPMSFDGAYCAPPGAAASTIDEQAVLRGVYYRRDGAVLRAFEGDAAPIPDRLRR